MKTSLIVWTRALLDMTSGITESRQKLGGLTFWRVDGISKQVKLNSASQKNTCGKFKTSQTN